jgi:hypothetical protein
VAELAALQRWFLDTVTHPDGVAAGAGDRGIASVVTPSRALDPAARIGIYAGMYFLRLAEVLEEDFAGLRARLGCEAADALFRAYLVAHPSRHPNLNELGARLPEFLAARDGAQPFEAELARLERSMQEVFDAPRASTLATDDLLAIPPDRFAELALPFAPAVRLHAFRYPVNEWFQAFRAGETRPRPEPEESWVVVYRRDDRVWRLPLEHEAHLLLAQIGAGVALGAALQHVEAAGLLGAVAPHLQGWFQDWAGLGLFAAPSSSAQRAS